MEMTNVVKKVKQINVTDLAGEKVMIDFASGKYFMLRGVGGDIWELIDDKRTTEDIVTALMAEYEIDRETCAKEVVNFLEQLVNAGLVQA